MSEEIDNLEDEEIVEGEENHTFAFYTYGVGFIIVSALIFLIAKYNNATPKDTLIAFGIYGVIYLVLAFLSYILLLRWEE